MMHKRHAKVRHHRDTLGTYEGSVSYSRKEAIGSKKLQLIQPVIRRTTSHKKIIFVISLILNSTS